MADLATLRGGAPAPADMPVAPAAGPNPGASANVSFADALQAAVGGVNTDDRAAAERMAAVDSGASDDLVGAMLSSQQASLSFSMLMQVRNKVMGAVDELIKLPL